jgi:hypothetical protein
MIYFNQPSFSLAPNLKKCPTLFYRLLRFQKGRFENNKSRLIPGSTVVKDLTLNPEINGSNPATSPGKGIYQKSSFYQNNFLLQN